MSLPMSCYVKMSPKGEKIPCRLFFKNNAQALVEFDTPREGLLVPGQFLVFYNREHDKGKVVGSGLVENSGMFDGFNYNTLPEKKEETDEDQEETNQGHIVKLGF